MGRVTGPSIHPHPPQRRGTHTWRPRLGRDFTSHWKHVGYMFSLQAFSCIPSPSSASARSVAAGLPPQGSRGQIMTRPGAARLRAHTPTNRGTHGCVPRRVCCACRALAGCCTGTGEPIIVSALVRRRSYMPLNNVVKGIEDELCFESRSHVLSGRAGSGRRPTGSGRRQKDAFAYVNVSAASADGGRDCSVHAPPLTDEDSLVCASFLGHVPPVLCATAFSRRLASLPLSPRVRGWVS